MVWRHFSSMRGWAQEMSGRACPERGCRKALKVRVGLYWTNTVLGKGVWGAAGAGLCPFGIGLSAIPAKGTLLLLATVHRAWGQSPRVVVCMGLSSPSALSSETLGIVGSWGRTLVGSPSRGCFLRTQSWTQESGERGSNTPLGF